jgi:hypothetical protein
VNTNDLDYRRGLILAILALRSSALFWQLVGRDDLDRLPPDLRRRVNADLGDVDAMYGFGPQDEGSHPNYLACCVEDAIAYVNRFM